MRSTIDICLKQDRRRKNTKLLLTTLLVTISACSTNQKLQHDHDGSLTTETASFAVEGKAYVIASACDADSKLLEIIGGDKQHWEVKKIEGALDQNDYEVKSRFYFVYDSEDEAITKVDYDKYKDKDGKYKGKKDRGARKICATRFGVNGVRLTFEFKSKNHLHHALFTFTGLNKNTPPFEYEILEAEEGHAGANGHGKGNGTGN